MKRLAEQSLDAEREPVAKKNCVQYKLAPAPEDRLAEALRSATLPPEADGTITLPSQPILVCVRDQSRSRDDHYVAYWPRCERVGLRLMNALERDDVGAIGTLVSMAAGELTAEDEADACRQSLYDALNIESPGELGIVLPVCMDRTGRDDLLLGYTHVNESRLATHLFTFRVVCTL